MRRTTKVISQQKKITSFTEDDVRWLRNRMDELLKTLKEERGISAEVARNITYGAYAFNVRVDIKAAPSKESKKTFVSELKWKATKIGIDSDWLGKEFIDADGNRCSIVDISTRSPRYPIILERLTLGGKKKTKCTVTYFNQLIELYN